MDGTSATILPSRTTTYPLTIALFGSFQVTRPDQSIVDFRSNKARAILIYLLLAQSKPVARASLTALLWPDYTATSARTNLRQVLANLREVLSPFDLLHGDYQTVQLRIDPAVIWCDALHFDELLESCQYHNHQAITTCPTCQSRLREATTLYKDTFLKHLPPVDSAPFTRWLRSQQTRYAERFAQSIIVLQSNLDATENARHRLSTPHRAWVGYPGAQQATQHNLPFQLTSFIGRAAVITELKTLLTAVVEKNAPALPRLITLTGAGGVGKTRLSLQVAAEILHLFSDGVWFIELAHLTDPTLLPATVAATLGVRAEADRSLLTTLCEWLQGRQILLILDNCEHLVEDCARFADALLRTTATLYILTSSREALGIGGELRYEVPALTFPLAAPLLLNTEAFTQYEAIHLFCERATLAKPTFRVTNANAPAIAQICQRLDGIPLAIELAAAQVKALTIETIATRLDDRFRLLVSGNRAALPRHQTLRALIDWSHDLLSAPEQILLRRLTIFTGGWTLEAAAAICADPTDSFSGPATGRAALTDATVLDCLTRLVEKSLVILDDHEGTARYRLLETIRDYGTKQLQAAQEAEWLGMRHFQFFVTLAEASETGLLAGNQRAQWLRQLAAEHDNLQVALTWACAHDPAVASRLAGLLRWYWSFSDQLLIAENWYQRVLAIYNPTPMTHARALALLGMGLITADLHSRQAARPFLEESIIGWQTVQAPEKLSEAFTWLAYVMLFSGEAKAVCTLCTQQESLLRGHTAPYILAHTLNFWGRSLILAHQDFATAQRLHEEALQLGQQWQDQLILGKTYQYLGHMAMQQGHYATAKRYYLEALAWRRQSGTKWLVGIALYNAADLLSLQNDLVGAQALYLEALALLRAVGLQYGVAYLLARVSDLATQHGDRASATAYVEECVALYQNRGIKMGVVQLIIRYAERQLQQGHTALAVRLVAVKALQHTAFLLNELLMARTLNAARAQLSAADFNMAWTTGQAMSLDEALSLTLSALDSNSA